MIKYFGFGFLSSFISMVIFILLIERGGFPVKDIVLVPRQDDEGQTQGFASLIAGTDWWNIFIASGFAIIFAAILTLGVTVLLESAKNTRIRRREVLKENVEN